MQLFVKGQDTTVLDVLGNEHILEIKQRIAANAGLPVEDQLLVYAGQLLDDSNTLSSYGIGDLATLSLSLRLVGGKVHGSLARAGKVKGQTPKVEKKEKRKKKTGRAKRRLQYNRRFVAVVPTFGRKKGPNAQNVAI